MIEWEQMKKPAKSRRVEGQVRVGLGPLRVRMKVRCAQLGIPMCEGIVMACGMWLKEEGRRKTAA